MFTIQGADGKEYGPVPVGKVHEWINGGRANLQTKARRVEETEWKTLGDYPEFTAPPPPPASPTLAPGGAADTIARPAVPSDPKVYADELIARAAPLDIFGCLSRSFELWKANLLPLVGVTTVVFIVVAVVGAIPLIGFICNLVLTGVFYGGLYYYYLGKMRGEPRQFGDAFAGFEKAFGPLALATLFTVLITGAAVVVLICPWFLVMGAMSGGHMTPHIGLMVVPGILLCCLPVIYITVAWSFTFPLVIDQGLSPWNAMEVSRRVVTKQWFRVFCVMFLGGILGILGVIGLIIGIFFTMPLAIGAILYAYEDLCRPPKLPSAPQA